MMKTLTRRSVLAAGLATLAAPMLATPAFAQSYPNRPVRLIIPFPPGNTSDLLSRIVAEAVQKRTGAAVVVENRPGASGGIGVQAVVSAQPDGYTLLVTTQSPIVVSPPLLGNLPYDTQKDLTPMALFGRTGFVLVVAPDFPAKTMAEVVEALRAQPPGHYSAANPGLGTMSHLAMELLNLQLGTKVVSVPYRGSSAALTDLGQGRVHLMIDAFNSAMAHANTGQSRAVAVVAPKRAARFPDLPSMAESGVAELAEIDAQSWTGLFGSAGTPPEVTAWWNEQLSQMMADPDIVRRFAAQYAQAVAPDGPERFAEEIASDLAKWTRVVREAKIEPPK